MNWAKTHTALHTAVLCGQKVTPNGKYIYTIYILTIECMTSAATVDTEMGLLLRCTRDPTEAGTSIQVDILTALDI